MKSEKSEILSKQAEAALRESEERFQLVAAAFELKRDSPNSQGKSRTTPYGSQ